MDNCKKINMIIKNNYFYDMKILISYILCFFLFYIFFEKLGLININKKV